MSFFNASAQAIQIARLHCMGDPSGIEQHPVFVTTITIDLTIDHCVECHRAGRERLQVRDRKSTRLNSSHGYISYAVFCLKKKNNDKSRSLELIFAYAPTTNYINPIIAEMQFQYIVLR